MPWVPGRGPGDPQDPNDPNPGYVYEEDDDDPYIMMEGPAFIIDPADHPELQSPQSPPPDYEDEESASETGEDDIREVSESPNRPSMVSEFGVMPTLFGSQESAESSPDDTSHANASTQPFEVELEELLGSRDGSQETLTPERTTTEEADNGGSGNNTTSTSVIEEAAKAIQAAGTIFGEVKEPEKKTLKRTKTEADEGESGDKATNGDLGIMEGSGSSSDTIMPSVQVPGSPPKKIRAPEDYQTPPSRTRSDDDPSQQ